jgi:hypothetical protein
MIRRVLHLAKPPSKAPPNHPQAHRKRHVQEATLEDWSHTLKLNFPEGEDGSSLVNWRIGVDEFLDHGDHSCRP